MRALLIAIGLSISTLLFSQPNWDWAVQFNTDFYDYAAHVDHDVNGNLYVCGEFKDSIVFGTPVLYGNTNDYSIFVVKYDPYGNLVWARTAACSNYSYARDICVAPDGSIYVTGMFSGGIITFGAFTLNGVQQQIYIVKYDPFGGVVWAKSAGGSDDDDAYTVTSDSNGDVVIGGKYSSSVCYFDSYSVSPVNQSATDGFVAKYDSNGNALWARTCGGVSYDNIVNVECDNVGNVYAGGTFRGAAMTAGSLTISGHGDYDMLILKYDSAGNEIWGRAFGGIQYEACTGTQITPSGNVVISGYGGASSMVVFDADTLFNINGGIYIATLDGAGNVLWAINEGSPGFAVSYTWWDPVGIDGIGDLYFAGHFTSVSADVSGDTIYNYDNSGTTGDFFIAKYDSLGNLIWLYQNGGTQYDAIFDITVKDIDNFAITGGFTHPTFLFPPDTLHNTGLFRYFLAQAGSGLTGSSLSGSGVPQFMIFPNPTSSELNVCLDQRFSLEEMSVGIYDLSGRTLDTYELNSHNFVVDCTTYKSGTYLLTVQTDDGAICSRMFVVE